MAQDSTATIHSSLSFGTRFKVHASLEDARDYAQKILVEAGWPADLARNVIVSGGEALVADDGDDETIKIHSLQGDAQ